MAGKADSSASLADVATLRQQTYLLFGSLFYHPDDELLAKIAAAADELCRGDELARCFPFYRRWRTLLGSLAELTFDDLPKLQEEYVDLFQVATSHEPCPLYESAYLDRTGRATGWIVSQVERSYASAGVGLSAVAGGELPDHVGLEMEFMSVLCEREVAGRRDGEGDAVAETLVLERGFLEQHPARWVALLADRIRHTAAEDSLYPRLGSATAAFVAHDRDLLAALTDDRGGEAPGPLGYSSSGRE